PFRVVDIDVQRLRIDIDQNWACTEIGHNFSRCRKRRRWDEYFVRLLNADCFESQMQCSRTRTYSNSILAPHVRRESALKCQGLRSHRKPTRANYFSDSLDLLLPESGPMEWNLQCYVNFSCHGHCSLGTTE